MLRHLEQPADVPELSGGLASAQSNEVTLARCDQPEAVDNHERPARVTHTMAGHCPIHPLRKTVRSHDDQIASFGLQHALQQRPWARLSAASRT